MRAKPITQWEDVPVIVDLALVCRILGISLPTAKKLVYNGELPAKKVGSCWRITKDALRQYVEAS